MDLVDRCLAAVEAARFSVTQACPHHVIGGCKRCEVEAILAVVRHESDERHAAPSRTSEQCCSEPHP